MITTIIIILVLLILFAKKQPNPDEYHAAFDSSCSDISIFNHGFAITGSKAITKVTSHTNVALFGPTGSGKTSTVILSSVISLAKSKSSIIFNDVSGEIFEKASGYLEQEGYTILRVNFSNASQSESFNPLFSCKTISDIQKIAALIVSNSLGENKSDPYWNLSSTMLISLFARYLIFHTEEQYRTLQNVLHLVETFAVNPTEIDTLIVTTNDEELLRTYKATVVLGDKTLQSIIANTRAALNLFTDKEVCKTTSTNSIDFTLLREQPVAIFISNPLKDLAYFKPLSALFFQSMFNYVLSRIPNKNERSIFFLIDEFATMKFPSLAVTVSNIRKNLSGILICMQDEQALIAQYGQAEAHQIKTNCGTQIYLKGQPLHTCKELSQILGKYTFVDKENNDKKCVRELMTPDEIRMTDDAIILISNQKPIKAKCVPYYKNWMIRKHFALPPAVISEKNVEEPVLIAIP